MNRCALSLAFAVSVFAGCSPDERAAVSGVVRFTDGTPVEGAQVVATAVGSGKTVYGSTDASGKFQLGTGNVGEGILPGEYNVVVIKKPPRGDQEGPVKNPIALKYSKVESSGLRFDVEAGETKEVVFELDLK